jgi:hypothetical protein
MNNENLLNYWFEDIQAIDYEITHQLLLKKLLSKPAFARSFCKVDSELIANGIKWEPYRGKFDLGVHFENGQEVLIELKMWSPLSEDDQLKKQINFIKEKPNRKGIHFLLGTSNYEYTHDYLKEKSEGYSEKYNYDDLIAILDNYTLIATNRQEKALLSSYQQSLHNQKHWIDNAWKTPEKVSKGHYFYSVYHQIQQRLPDTIKTKIFTTGRNADKILQSLVNWTPFALGKGKGEIYLEIINGIIALRFFRLAGDINDLKRIKQYLIQHHFKSLLEKHPTATTKGQATKYMKMIRMPMDFGELGMDGAVGVYLDWQMALREVKLSQSIINN